MLWNKKPTLEQIQNSIKNTMCEHLGMVFTEVGDDFITAKMPVDHRTKQPAGLLHGGASAALAETLGSIASALCLEDSQSMPVGIEINANHIRSALSGDVFGTVRPVRVGRSLHVWNIEIKDDHNHLICTSRLTVMVVPKRKS